MSVVVEKPYTFVPPYRGNVWPNFIQSLRLVDLYLRLKEGVVSYECRHAERLAASLQADSGILLAPNHCRYADPLVMGWLSRSVGQHVYAMASWHLFNKGWLDRFSIPKMGGFSIWREGLDRKSLEMAIDILVTSERPLIVFPEGTTNRTNDRIQPLLDGVPFMARTAARRRAKAGRGPVVVHPVGIKYLFRGDIHDWATQAIDQLETRLSWRRHYREGLLQRIARLAEGLLSLKEVEYLGAAQRGDLLERRDALISVLLDEAEQRLGCLPDEGDSVLHRVRTCRSRAVGRLLNPETSEAGKVDLRDWARRVELAQQLVSYPADYLEPGQATDTRVLETLQRMQEDFLGEVQSAAPLHVVIEVETAIEVSEERIPKGQSDPMMEQLREQLTALAGRLSREARPLDGTS